MFLEQASAILEIGDPAVAEADLATLAIWLARQFLRDINERRQRELGVTHYIWRSREDAKVRTVHAERDDRLFSWDDRFSDGHTGHGYNCRCTAEPAILDGAILLTEVTLSEGLSNRIADAQGAGLADAAAEAAAGGVEALYSTLRFSWLGYRRLFGVMTPEEEAERLAMREGLIRTIDTIIKLDAETARSMAEAFVDYFDARYSDLRLLDIEHRLGVASAESLLIAYRQVAYLDASVTLGAVALTTVASGNRRDPASAKGCHRCLAVGCRALRRDARHASGDSCLLCVPAICRPFHARPRPTTSRRCGDKGNARDARSARDRPDDRDTDRWRERGAASAAESGVQIYDPRSLSGG